MGGFESSKFMTGQRFKSARNLCIRDTQVATSSMSASGRQTKDTCDLTIANGVTLTITSRATRTARSLTLTTLTVGSVIPDASHAGDPPSFTVFPVLSMVSGLRITREELCVQPSAEMEGFPWLMRLMSMNAMMETTEDIN